jgi:peptidoglycan/xylan/chitin deacetylase (PgdA/CDA1 family)
MMNTLIGILKKPVYTVASWEPILRAQRARKLRNGIVVLMYHEVAPDDHDIEAWTVVKQSDFVKQMNYLRTMFKVVSLGEALRLMEHVDDIQEPTVVITFDDGYSGNKRIVLPIIKSMNIPVTIFVSTRAVQDQIVYWYDRLIHALQNDRVINIDLRHISLNTYCINRVKGAENWAEIQRLLTDLKTLQPTLREITVKNLEDEHNSLGAVFYHLAPLTIDDVRESAGCPLVTIGAHSHCHNILTQLSDEETAKSILTSKTILESWIDRPVTSFAYPNGNYNDMVVKSLRECGFKCSLTTVARPWKKEESNFTIPRMGIGRYDSLDYFKIKVSGGLF